MGGSSRNPARPPSGSGAVAFLNSLAAFSRAARAKIGASGRRPIAGVI
jgi:hypothetical protein